MLRLSNEIGNQSNGPLEVFPGAVSANCDGDGDPANDRDASQRIFADSNGSGLYEPGIDAIASERMFGCMRYHAAHDHWHVLDIARYELRREATGKLVAQSQKIGFCLTDTRIAFPSAAAPPAPDLPDRVRQADRLRRDLDPGDLGRVGGSLRLRRTRTAAPCRWAAARQLLPHLAGGSARSDRRARRGQQRAAGATHAAPPQAAGPQDRGSLPSLRGGLRRRPARRARARPRPARRRPASAPPARAGCRAGTTRRRARPCSRCLRP